LPGVVHGVLHGLPGICLPIGAKEALVSPSNVLNAGDHTLQTLSEKAIQGTLPLTPVLALNANTYWPNVFRKGH